MSNKFIILTELGKEIGLGHYTRCSALYQFLIANGMNGTMYVNQINNTNEYPFSINYNWLKNTDFINNLDENSLIIIDSYLFEIHFLKVISKLQKNIVVIDDYNRMIYEGVSLIINPNVYFSLIDYSNQTAETIGGKDYIILRASFRNYTFTNIAKSNCLNLLVTIGGSDYRNLLPNIISHLNKNFENKFVVIDPENKISKDKNSKVTLLDAQDELQILELMNNADIVISACGQTLHELASIGKATIGICIDKDQILNQEFYFKHKFLSDLIYWDDNNLLEKLTKGIDKYRSITMRNKIKIESASLINKLGVNNIVEKLKNQHVF